MDAHFHDFIPACCVFRENAFAARLALYEAYEKWARDRSKAVVSFALFRLQIAEELGQRGVVAEAFVLDPKGERARGFAGVALRGSELRIDGQGVLRAA
jgi:hypothetical protein